MTDGASHRWFIPVVFIGGNLFGFGLAFSHMTQPEVVLSFLQFTDLGLMFVMGAGAGVTGLAFYFIPKTRAVAPLTKKPYSRRLRSFDSNIITGGIIFGIGWGLSGMCPGAAYASVGIGNYPIVLGILGMFIGAYVQGALPFREYTVTVTARFTNSLNSG